MNDNQFQARSTHPQTYGLKADHYLKVEDSPRSTALLIALQTLLSLVTGIFTDNYHKNH
jgi:hypothetical protein